MDAADPVAAQLVGGAGYLLLLIATQADRTRRFLALDATGLVPVVIHYLMLGAGAGAVMSALYLLVDVVHLLIRGARAAFLALALAYAAALSLLILWFEGPIDLLALAGTVAAIQARREEHMIPLLSWIIVSCVGWGIYGYLAGSYAQLAFSTLYAAASAVGILRLRRPIEASRGLMIEDEEDT